MEKDLGQLLFRTGLEGKNMLCDDTMLTGQQQLQILSNALDISGDPAFGLRFGDTLTPSTHGPLGFLINSSPTLIKALEAFREYLPLRMNLTQLKFTVTDQWLDCEMEVNPCVNLETYRLVIEALVQAVLFIVEFVLGRPLTDGILTLDYSPPSYVERYADFYSCPVQFLAKKNLLRIPVGLINTLNVSSEHTNYEFSLKQCQHLLQKLSGDNHETQSQVRKLLLSHTNHQLSEEDVAATLFVSKRTLARRLARENTGFRKLREEVLASLAEGYLRDTRLSTDAIAGLLNYYDSANFRRAFKRWYKMPPEQFRSRMV
jgi:AraC-like DNA-binding protein